MLTKFSMLFHLTSSIINKQGKIWQSLYLIGGLTDVWNIFDVMSMVTGGRWDHTNLYPIPQWSNMKRQSFM